MAGPINRRELLRVGGLTLFGAGLADLLRLESQAASDRQHHRGRFRHPPADPIDLSPLADRTAAGICRVQSPWRGTFFAAYWPLEYNRPRTA